MTAVQKVWAKYPDAFWCECASPQGMKHRIETQWRILSDWMQSEEAAWGDAARRIEAGA